MKTLESRQLESSPNILNDHARGIPCSLWVWAERSTKKTEPRYVRFMFGIKNRGSGLLCSRKKINTCNGRVQWLLMFSKDKGLSGQSQTRSRKWAHIFLSGPHRFWEMFLHRPFLLHFLEKSLINRPVTAWGKLFVFCYEQTATFQPGRFVVLLFPAIWAQKVLTALQWWK